MRVVQTIEGERIQLATREREVIRLAAMGRANKEIATSLAMAESTVKHHLSLFSEALGFDNRVQVSLWVICHPEALRGIAVAREPRVPACLSDAA